MAERPAPGPGQGRSVRPRRRTRQSRDETLTLRAAADAAASAIPRDSLRQRTEGTTNLSILLADFARQTGDIDTASDLVRRHAAIALRRTQWPRSTTCAPAVEM
jgi:hypothetical protein